MIKCKCGADMLKEAKFCGICGAKNEPVPEPAPVPIPEPAPVIEPVPAPVPIPEPAPVIEPVPAPEPAPVIEPVPAPEPVPTVMPTPEFQQAAPEFRQAMPEFQQAMPKFQQAVPEFQQAMPEFQQAVPEFQQAVPAFAGGKRIFGFDMKKVIVIAGAALLALFVLIAVIFIISPSKYQKVRGSVFAMPIDDEFSIIYPHGKAGVRIQGSVNYFTESLDGTKAAVLVSDDESDEGYTLYIVGSKVERIDRDVRDFWLAPNGGAIAFTKYYNDDETGELFLWNGSSVRKISNDLALYDGWGWKSPEYDCVISPDGKTVGFVADKGVDTLIGIVWNNGRENELDRRELYRPAAVANNARYIYYYRDDTLFVQKSFNETTRTRLGTDVYIDAFNRDLSQVVFSSGSRSLISDKGKTAVPLSGELFSFILPANTRQFSAPEGVIIGVGSFADTYYYNGSIIRIRNNKFDTDSVMRSVDTAYLADDGKTLTYLRNEAVFKVSGSASNPTPTELVRDNVKFFIATDNGKAIFYIDNFDDISFKRGTSREVTIAYSFTGGMNSGVALFRGKTLFFIQDGALFSSTGRSSTKIGGISVDLYLIYADAAAVYAVGQDSWDTIIYRSTNGRRFTEVK